MKVSRLSVHLILALFLVLPTARAQEIPMIGLTLDEQLFLVLTGNGFATTGIDIQSQSGSLVPIPPGDLTADASPFDLALVNKPEQITLGNLGHATVVDGRVKLDARWNPGGDRDIRYAYGDGPVAVGMFEIDAEAYDQCPVCLPQIGVGLNDDYRIVLSGVGQQLTKLELHSRSGSLVPSESSAPFTNLLENSRQRIQFESASDPVLLEGDLTIGAGWNDHIGGRDLSYQYEATGDGQQGPFLLDVNDYPPRPFLPGIVNAHVDPSDRIVLTGAGHPLTRMTLRSQSGSLIPAAGSGPFETLASNTNAEITYSAPTRGSQVVLDGALRLDAGWDPAGEQDITFDYSIAGDARDAGLFRIHDRNYLAGSGATRLQHPEQLPRIQMSLNEDGNFVLTSDGRSIQTLGIGSTRESLIPASDPGPFDQLLANGKQSIVFRTQGGELRIDGSVTLPAGWNVEKAPEVNYSYFSRDGIGVGFELSPEQYAACRQCPKPRLNVSLDGQQRFVLTGEGQQLANLVIASPQSGALLPATTAAPFSSLGENTPHRIEFETLNNSPVTIDGSVTLSAGWNVREPTQDVQIEYQNAGQQRLEKFGLPSRAYPNAPRYSSISVTLDDDNKFVLSGTGQPLTAMEFTSRTDSLAPAVSAAPFQQLGENTSSRIEFGSPTDSVLIDGHVTLSAGWDPEKPPQVRYQYTLLERSQQVGPRTMLRNIFPEPEPEGPRPTIFMTIDDDLSLVLNGNGFETAGIDIQSTSGSLVPIPSTDQVADPSPFELVLANSPTNVVLGNVGTKVLIEGSVKLGTQWNPAGEPDIRYFYGDGAKPVGPFGISFGNYLRHCPNCLAPNSPTDDQGGGAHDGDDAFFVDFSSVYLDITDSQTLAVRGTGQAISSLVIESRSGGLITNVDDQGIADPGPFDGLIDANGGKLLLYDNQGPLILDGVLDLGVAWHEEFTGPRAEFVDHLFTDVSAQIGDRRGNLFDIQFWEPFDPSSIEVRLSANGEIVVVGNGLSITGINVTSAAGNLVTKAPGDLSDSAGPFAFLLANNANQVTFGNLGGTVDLNGELNLGIVLDAVDLASSDLVVEIGLAGQVISIPIREVLPEPSSALLLILGLVVALRQFRLARRF